MRFRVEKLIRDRMPGIMRAQGLRVFERRLDDAEFAAALRAKLLEEAREAADAGPGDLLDELADVTEVLLALAGTLGLGAADIERARLAKHARRGGFTNRVHNAAVEAEPGLPAAEYYLARPDQYPLTEPEP